MFRFTIRELLVLTITAGIAVGWWIDHKANAANAEAAQDAKFLAQVAEHGCHCQMVDTTNCARSMGLSQRSPSMLLSGMPYLRNLTESGAPTYLANSLPTAAHGV